MHLNIVLGDFKFAAWEEKDDKRFNKKIDELRKQGYRKIDHYYDSLNHYQIYKKKKSKKEIVLTMMCL